MGARQKLNSAYLMGNFVLAVLVGGMTRSIVLGVIAFALGVGCSLVGEEIRLGGRDSSSGVTVSRGAGRSRRR